MECRYISHHTCFFNPFNINVFLGEAVFHHKRQILVAFFHLYLGILGCIFCVCQIFIFWLLVAAVISVPPELSNVLISLLNARLRMVIIKDGSLRKPAGSSDHTSENQTIQQRQNMQHKTSQNKFKQTPIFLFYCEINTHPETNLFSQD